LVQLEALCHTGGPQRVPFGIQATLVLTSGDHEREHYGARSQSRNAVTTGNTFSDGFVDDQRRTNPEEESADSDRARRPSGLMSTGEGNQGNWWEKCRE